MNLLNEHDYSIKRQVINFNSRIIGVIAQKNKSKDSMYIPSAPSALIFDNTIKTIFSHNYL